MDHGAQQKVMGEFSTGGQGPLSVVEPGMNGVYFLYFVYNSVYDSILVLFIFTFIFNTVVNFNISFFLLALQTMKIFAA